jgi:AraC-like DNA-binding protein
MDGRRARYDAGMDRIAAFADLLERHTGVDGTHAVALPGVRLIRASSPTVPMPVIYEPTVCLVAQGVKQAWLGTTAYRYDPAHYLVASVDLPVMGAVVTASAAQPYLCLQLDLDVATLSELLLQHPALATGRSAPAAGLSLTATHPDLLDAATRLVGLLDAPADVSALAPLIQREILYRLLQGPAGGVIRHMAQADSRLRQIARAIVWIKAHFRGACRIEDAAGQAGMGRSSFHQHFKAITTLSPLEYRNLLRLQEARRLMVGAAMDAATAGFTVGYESPSQFSRDYARAFGLPPARDAGRLREAASAHEGGG